MNARLTSRRLLTKTQYPIGVAHLRSRYSTIEKCPAPTCSCGIAPSDLDIDYSRALGGTAPAYAQHVMIDTGKRDWTRRIEDDGEGTGWGELGRKLKSMLNRGGEFADPYNNVLLSNISFTPNVDPAAREGQLGASAMVWSRDLGLRRFRNIVVDDGNVRRFVQTQLLPQQLHPAHDKLSDAQKGHWIRDIGGTQLQATTQALNEPLILICGHGERDRRCGILGPMLQDEVSQTLKASRLLQSAQVNFSQTSVDGDSDGLKVGLCSHIGGHRFAGNMIIYFPRQYRPTVHAAGHPLQGCGVWYGRVEPKHVEGILDRTICKGQIIEELLRGVQHGQAPTM